MTFIEQEEHNLSSPNRSASNRTSARAAKLYVLFGVFVAFAIWMSLSAYQSHYISALRTLGDATTQSYLGSPKEGRGDEWSTYLPILKQAYHEGFPAISNLKPYYERLDWFIAIPHANLSLLFLPNQIAYWLIPGGKALSFQGFYYNALFIASFTWFLFNLGIKPRLAFVVAIAVLFSQFYQMWWTSNFPALGASILPFAVFTSRIRSTWKYPLLFWSLAHMLFGQMYPPFYISLAVALIPFTLAARPDLMTPQKLGLAAVAGAGALAAYLALNWDYVQLVSATTYPGHRISTGGTSSWRALVDLIFPTFPLGSGHDNDRDLYELNMAATFLPLMLLAVLPWVKWDKKAMCVTIVSALTGLVIVYYMLVGFPELLAKVTGFYLVPARRMHLGLSLLVSCYAAFMLSNNWDKIRLWPLLLVASGYAAVSYFAGVGTNLQRNFFGVSLYGWALLAFVLVGLLVAAAIPFFRRKLVSVVAVSAMVGMTVFHIVVFGSFNPVMRADDILRPVDSQVTRDWKALYEKNDDRPFGILGNYGDVLRGEGLAALEAIHLANVKPYVYSKIFPNLTLVDIDALFNGFRGIAFANIPGKDPEDVTAATLVFPLEPHSVPFAHTTVINGSAPTIVRGVSAKAYRESDGFFKVYWGASLVGPLRIDAPLVLSLSCPVEKSWLTRYPVTIVGAPLVDVALQGIAGEVVVPAVTEADALKCVSDLKVSSQAYEPLAGVSDTHQTSASKGDTEADSIPENIEGATPLLATLRARKAGICSLDTVAGIYSSTNFNLTAGRSYVFRGWFVDDARRPAGEFSIILKGRQAYRIVAHTGVSRPDVGIYFHNEVASGAGFNVDLSLAAVSKGIYSISYLVDRGEDRYMCDGGKTITIR
jgi:hypothetical protein